MFRGPDDNGIVVDGPGVLATAAFEQGALHVSKLNLDRFIILFEN
jgi:hypothetical protein